MQATADTRVASRVRFITFCNILKRLKDARSSKERKRIITEFISNWREWHKQSHSAEPETDDSMFNALRLLAPELDKTRPAYGMKEKSLAKLYAETLRISDESTEGRRLASFHLPSAWNAHAGDLAQVVFDILQTRAVAEASTYTLTMINEALDELATGDKQQIRARMLSLIHDLSPIEQKFLIRIILKDPGVGLSGKSVLSAYHSDAEQLFAVTQSLERVAHTLRDPTVRLREVAIALNVPFQPQLAENCPLRDLLSSRLRGAPFLLETKFDGERVQLHKDGTNYRYFSRSGNDWSATYGETATTSGSLSRYIDAQFAPHVRNCILDGEMMLFDPRTGNLVTKAETDVDVKRNNATDPDSLKADANLDAEDDDEIEGNSQLGATATGKRKSTVQTCFVAFDVLLLNDRVLTSVPLRERKAELARVVTPLEGRIHVATGQPGSTRADCITALNAAMARGEEGIVVKRLDSVYECAARRAGWFKLKADYIDGLCDELDLLVLGAYFGVGSVGHYRTGSISHFLVGLRDDDAAPGAAATDPQYGSAKFVPLVKVSTGFSARQLRDLSMSLGSKLHKYSQSEIPSIFRLSNSNDADNSKRLREWPDFWLLPADSCVVQVRAAEIMPSSVYPTGFTLRHARARAIRRDRSWRDAMSTREFEQLRIASNGRLVCHELTEAHLLRDDERATEDSGLFAKLDFDDDDAEADRSGVSPRKRDRHDDESRTGGPSGTSPTAGQGGRGRRKIQIAAACRGVDSRSVARISEVFGNDEFCVLLPSTIAAQKRSVDEQLSKADVEKLILAHGGRVVQNASVTSTRYVVANATGSVRATWAMQSGAYDVVRPSWVIRCTEARRLIEPIPADFVYMRAETRRRFAKLYDQFGDAFKGHLESISHLKDVFSRVSSQTLDSMTMKADDIFELHQNEIGLLAESGNQRDSRQHRFAKAGLFRPLRFALPRFWQHTTVADLGEGDTLELKRRIIICKLQLFGGEVAETDDYRNVDCSHVILVESSSSAAMYSDALKTLVNKLVTAAMDSDGEEGPTRRKVPRVVSARWVDDCVQRDELLEERAYWPLG